MWFQIAIPVLFIFLTGRWSWRTNLCITHFQTEFNPCSMRYGLFLSFISSVILSLNFIKMFSRTNSFSISINEIRNSHMTLRCKLITYSVEFHDEIVQLQSTASTIRIILYRDSEGLTCERKWINMTSHKDTRPLCKPQIWLPKNRGFSPLICYVSPEISQKVCCLA